MSPPVPFRRPLHVGAEILVRGLLTPVVLGHRWLRTAPAANPHVPPVRPTLGTGVKAVLDEAFFLTEVLSARFVSVIDRARIVEEVAAATALFVARGWLATPAAYHRTPPAPTAVRLEPRRSALGRAYAHLSLPSAYAPLPDEPGAARWNAYAANQTLHAWVLEHTDRPRPWLVCLPGYRTGYPLADFVQFPPAWLHERLGLNLLVPVLPLHGLRARGRRSGDGFFTGDLMDTVHLLAQAVWDVRRLLGWLRARTDTPIAVYGLSLGGATAALLAGLDPRIDCLIAGMPAGDLLGLARHHVPPFLLSLAERVVASEAAGRLLHVVSPLALAPRLPPHRLFLYAGLADRLVPPAHAADLWAHWGEPRLAWYAGSHVSFALERTVRDLVEEALATTGVIALPGRG